MSGATSADFAGSMMSATWPVPSRTAPCMSSQTPRRVRIRERICGSPSSCAARTRAAKPCAWKGSRRSPTSEISSSGASSSSHSTASRVADTTRPAPSSSTMPGPRTSSGVQDGSATMAWRRPGAMRAAARSSQVFSSSLKRALSRFSWARPQAASPYPNFVEEPADASAFFDPATWARLRTVKAAYDPANVFVGNHHIPPA